MHWNDIYYLLINKVDPLSFIDTGIDIDIDIANTTLRPSEHVALRFNYPEHLIENSAVLLL